MRINLRIKVLDWTFFMMLAKTQTLEGVTSCCFDENGKSDGMHFPMWDLERCTLEEAYESLRSVHEKYGLGDIFMVSDKIGSYRAWCFTRVPLKTYLHILLDTEHLDWNFFYWTVHRGKATLRTSNKQGREPQKVVKVLSGSPEIFPTRVEQVLYDTGVEKRGNNILLGGD
jgi:hypothetical protein